MDDRQRELDRRIRSAQRREFFRQLWEARLLVIGGAALLGTLAFGMAFNATPTHLQATVLAHVVNDGNVQTTRKGAQFRHETIQLDTGATITLDLPASEPIRHDAPMKVEIYEKDWGPLHQVTYRFAGYADEPQAS